MTSKKHINVSERILLLRIFDVVFALLGLFGISYFFDFSYIDRSNEDFLSWLITLSVYLLFFGQVFEMYRLKVASDNYLVVRSVFVTSLVTTIFFIFTPVLAPVLPSKRIHILYLFFGIFLPILIWRFAYILLIFTPKYFKYVLVLGESKSVARVIDLISVNAPANYIVGYFSDKKINRFDEISFFDKQTTDLKEIVKKYYVTEVIVTDRLNFEKSNLINKHLIQLFETGIAIKNIENYYEEIMSCIPRRHLTEDFYKNISFSKTHESRIYLVLSRFFDVIFSLFGLLFMILILPFVIVGNLIANRGPLFYTQDRVGVKGKVFKIIKFRSMVQNAEKNGAVWAEKEDPRVTLFGKLLRRTRFDEIPQFFNIIRGQMALIGPRPERPEFVKKLNKKIPLFEIRHVIKPGLTGWAQVMYPYASSIEEQNKKLRFDLYYIKNRSFYLDFKIIFKTISTVLFFRGH
ncbi:MAG: exopolysaccharide biosynthesis polyprenyl glycosylphosphotransferase [Flavobacteriaceae bacterium]|nr:exopolysaccharide biosynthesis polyprenyl glycosylphosphotransferase [Flavobacteriaceae bacterium]